MSIGFRNYLLAMTALAAVLGLYLKVTAKKHGARPVAAQASPAVSFSRPDPRPGSLPAQAPPGAAPSPANAPAQVSSDSENDVPGETLERTYRALLESPAGLLEIQDDALRHALLNQIARSADDRFVEPLYGMLGSPEPDLHYEATVTLGRMRTASSRQALQRFAQENPARAKLALEALSAASP